MRNSLMYRMENASATGRRVEGGADLEESLTIEETVPAESREVIEEGEQLESDFDEVDTVAEGLQEINDISGSMEESLENGGEGLSESAAVHLESRMRSAYAKVGIRVESTNMRFRRENYKTSSSRRTNTQRRLEENDSIFAKAKEKLIKLVNWIKDAVMSQYNKLTKNAKGVSDRFEDIQKRLNDLPSDVENSKDRLTTRAKFFSVDGKCEDNNIKDVVDNVLALHAWASGPSLKGLLDYTIGGNLNNPLSSVHKSAPLDGLSSGLTDRSKTTSSFKRNIKDAIEKPTIQAEKAQVFGTLPDGKALVLTPQKINSGSATNGNTPTYAHKLEITEVEDRFASDWKAPTTTAEISKLLAHFTTVVEKALELERTKKEIEAQFKTFENAIENLIGEKSAEKDSRKNEDNSAERKTLGENIEKLRIHLNNVKAVSASTPNMVFQTAAAGCDMGAAAVSNMKKKS